MQFSGEVTVACTFNASAFNTLWAAFDKIDPDGDGNINIPPELIDGLADYLAQKADQVDLEKEIAERKAADADLQKQIDELPADGGGGGVSSWNDLTDKPTEFPPESHEHQQSEIDGLEDGSIRLRIQSLAAAVLLMPQMTAHSMAGSQRIGKRL